MVLCLMAFVVALVASLRARPPLSAPGGGADDASRRGGVALFTHSDNCVSCHNQLTTAGGEDVSIGTAWRSTLMANAARDPYFHASVRRETVDHPEKSAEIQHECAACHMPIVQKIAHAQGRTATVLTGRADHDKRLAADGVSCTVCHQISSERLGTPSSFNGNFVLQPTRPDGVRDIFGPFNVDRARHTIMRSATGFEQVEASHVRQSELCATCHTLITSALGPDGRVIGSLPEQMNFQEWQHSAYPVEGRGCQACHMPRAEGPIRVSSVLGAERDGLSRHAFVGGNAFMLRMMNRFRTALGVEAEAGEIEATARLTEQQLRDTTASLTVSVPTFSGASVGFDVEIQNLTGHKYPTGYPSRRTWLHVMVRASTGRPVFESGAVNRDGSIQGNDNDADGQTYEPHYGVIERPEQVQIYEAILGDAAGRTTTGLLSAVSYLKDNRLLPRGFDKITADPQVGVYGAARDDADFAAGGDRVHYQVPLPDVAGSPWTIDVELQYQPIGYRWSQNLQPYSEPEPVAFLRYFDAASSTASTVLRRAVVTARR